MIRLRFGLVSTILVLSLLVDVESGARAASVDSLRTGTAAPRVAAILFLSYQVSGPPPADLGALHSACWDRLDSTLGELGHVTISRAALDDPIRRWKVRDDLGVSRGFLNELATDLNAPDLLICDLVIYGGGLLLAARDVRTETGDVSWADIEESQLTGHLVGEGAADPIWTEETESALRRLLARRESRDKVEDRSGSVCMLPARSAGLSLLAGRVMQACILHTLLESGWQVEDPGVTFGRLREAGVDPEQLDARTRPALIASGTRRELLLCDLVAWENAASSRTNAYIDARDVAVPQALVPPALLSIRLVDLESGAIVFAGSDFVRGEPSYGLFGILRDKSPGRRLLSAAERLVHGAGRKG